MLEQGIHRVRIKEKQMEGLNQSVCTAIQGEE